MQTRQWQGKPQETKKIEQSWGRWIAALFPKDKAPLAKHHGEFWDWVWDLDPDEVPNPFTGFWSRGGAKSTNVERAVAAIGATGKRPYVLYVCGTQQQADDHVANISTILQSNRIAHYYPDLSSPALNRFGNVKGWRRNRLQTAAHFTVDALGLDTASIRGIKVDDDRPGLIILDDIDDGLDSEAVSDKKVELIANKILPAGATNLAVIFIQNLIGTNTVAARLAKSEGAKPIDMLHKRIISGPFPALLEFEYEANPEGGYTITHGIPTWEGQSVAICQQYVDLFGISAFLSECQHDLEPPDGEMFTHLIYQLCRWEEIPTLERTVVWLDPAVTNTDRSDSQGIQADGLAADGRIYRLFSWEGRTSPQKAVRRAILKAVELSEAFGTPIEVGIETDQGGDTWDSVFDEAVRMLREEGEIGEWERPIFKEAKAGAGHGAKVHRMNQQVAMYERGLFVHLNTFHEVLRRAQKRVPKTKPFDLVDVGYWSAKDLLNQINRVGATGKVPSKQSNPLVPKMRGGYRMTG